MRRFTVLFVLALSSLAFAQEAKKPDPPKAFLLKSARVVVKPGTVLENTDILLVDGKIAAIGPNLAAKGGAEEIDCSGLTAYAGFVHPFLRVTVSGTSPNQPADAAADAPAGGTRRQPQSASDAAAQMARRDKDPFGIETNLLTKIKTADLKQKDVSSLDSLAKSGFGAAQLCATGGLLGPCSAVYGTSGKDLDPAAVLSTPNFVPVSFSSRGFGSYPSSAMGAVAFVRQALLDAQRYGRLMQTAEKPQADPSLAALEAVTGGRSRPVFDDLNEVTFFEAEKVVGEFGLAPIYGFRQDAGSVADRLKLHNATVMLRGSTGSKPTVGDNLDTASLRSVRGYFNEAQTGGLLERAGVGFVYAPTSMTDPLKGIREYVRFGLSPDGALAAMTTRPAELLGLSDQLGALETGKLGNLVLTDGDLFSPKSQIMAVFSMGQRIDFKMPERKKPEPEAAKDTPSIAPNFALFPRPAETTPAFRLYRNATVWTMAKQGVLKGADVLVHNGKIEGIGRGLKAPAGCEVIDASGKHISPGIWDCHSHTGVNGGVNEGTNMVTIECRISDVINHQSVNIYQQLSGGTVGAQQLHGSANVIGGQTSPVKWRWGMRPADYPISGAPGGVKFALGQNPIREDSTGFGQQQQPIGTTLMTWRPRTRMGNEESIRRALQLGREYNQAWDDYRSGKTKVEPRRDLQLEGLGEIVSGKRLVHSHGYRSDELLMLMRVVPEFGGKIATLQHVLEGYKIADEMAAAGVGGSTFADWWGYKLEAYDAIPYNAALMAARGVSVSVNSDSDNHARRLNQEAAKSMRYGGVSAEKALSFVTIEPAKQMGIADHTGSLEVGKDADMVLWSADPTTVFAVCLETYVDGVKRFDRVDDAKQRADREAELKLARALLDPAPPKDAPAPLGSPEAPSSARFGIGPVKSEPGTSRYPRKSVLIRGAKVHPMAGEPFVGDVVVGANGKIESVGSNLSASGATVVDGRGKHLYPGLIDPVTSIGLNEIGQVPTSDDSSERGNFHPDYRVERVINPEWETMGVARQQGVLTVMVKPAGGGVAGQAALINTEGYTWEDLTLLGGAAMVVSSSGGAVDFGNENDCEDDGDMMAGQNRGGPPQDDAPQILKTLSKQLDDAREYVRKRAAATPDKPVPMDQRQEAMARVANGEQPVMLSTSSASDMKGAVAWAEKERVRIVLYGCSGAGEIADWLAQRQVPICLNAVFRMPGNEQPVDAFYSLPAKLAKAGVKFCLTTENDKDVRQIRDQAGWAAAYGLDREESARIVTLRAAEVLGIADRIGAIKTGMDGTLILTDGEIIETKTKVLRAWIEGREIDLGNRQTRLYDKYRTRPRVKG